MTDRSNLHLTGSAGWCQFRRIIAPFSSPSSAFLLHPPAFLRTYIARHTRSPTPFSYATRAPLALYFRVQPNFSEMTLFFFQTRIFPQLDENTKKLWHFYFSKKYISLFFGTFHNRKKKIAESLEENYPRIEYRGSWYILSMSPHVRVSDTRYFTCSHVTLETRSSNTGAVRPYGHVLVWTARADHVAEQ